MNVQLAQVLLEPGDDATRRIFESRRFIRMAELIYLHTAIRRPLPPPPLPPGWVWHSYGPKTHQLFADAILASYQQSLDCPGLTGVREIEDIIAGHKASGEFDPAYWTVLCRTRSANAQGRGAEEALGVLLLSRLPRGDTVELVYIGLSPEARGLQLGEWLMRHALHSALSMGVLRLSLAVDSINRPALKLYYRFGLSRMGSKIALMRRLS
jgi:GNAT superfamily N-acetyltransferase